MPTAFNVPSPKSYFRQNHEKFWELTEFLNEHEVFNSKKDVLIEMYAKAAAFGDFLEVGDRHFENYISRGITIIAIDVAHLIKKIISIGQKNTLPEVCMRYVCCNIT